MGDPARRDVMKLAAAGLVALQAGEGVVLQHDGRAAAIWL